MEKESQKSICPLGRCARVLMQMIIAVMIFLMLMLIGTEAEAADNAVPEVLRYAQQYARDGDAQPASPPEEGLARKLARLELIRRQQQMQIETLEKQLQTIGADNKKEGKAIKEIARLTQERQASEEKVKALTQEMGKVKQENVALRAEIARTNVKETEKLRQTLRAAQEKSDKLMAQINALQQVKSVLQAQRESDQHALQQADAGLKAKAAEVLLLQTALTAASDNANILNGQWEKSAQATKARPDAEVSLKTPESRLAYAAGVMYSRDVSEAREGNQMLGINLDNAALTAGLHDALTGNPLRLSSKELASATQDLVTASDKAFRKVVERQKALADAWLKTFRKKKDVTRDDLGFWYRIAYLGDGERLKPEDVVDVVVEERLADGKVVSDMDSTGSHLRQKVAEFPPVFKAGLSRLKNHGQITLVVPPELAYGDRGYPPDVPPGAMMIYHVRVADVIRGKERVVTVAAGR